jgi:outer membrane protein OmpA-like peptidoglycan-associated protein
MAVLTKALTGCVLASVAALTAACSLAGAAPQGPGDGSPGMTCTTPDGLGLIIGAHRNVPAPQLSPRAQCDVTMAITHRKPVFIVVADGSPRAYLVHLLPVTGGTKAGQDARINENGLLVSRAVSRARPGSPGVDDLAALAVASDEARTLGLPHAVLILMDAGLDDRGALNFTRPGMLAAEPGDLTGQLKGAGDDPHLVGMSVILSGIGYTAAPQPPLPVSLRTNLTSIWSAVIAASGGTVTAIDPDPGSGPSLRTRYPVGRVPIPAQRAARPRPGRKLVFDAQSPVSFVGNSAAFLNPAAARSALAPIGRWLHAGPERHATIVGTTMNYGRYAGQKRLSLARARAAAAVIRSTGASASQITVRGVGSHFPQYVRPDKGAAGSPLPAAAVANRSVRISLSGPAA